jgi:hypothetical protein
MGMDVYGDKRGHAHVVGERVPGGSWRGRVLVSTQAGHRRLACPEEPGEGVVTCQTSGEQAHPATGDSPRSGGSQEPTGGAAEKEGATTSSSSAVRDKAGAGRG